MVAESGNPFAHLTEYELRHLPALARRTRADLLSDLQALVPVIATLGGETAVVETFNAVADVGRWWP